VFFRLYNHALERFQRAIDVCNFTGIHYDVFLLAVRGVASGSIDSSRYEECCRFLMGAHSHLFLFLDKLLIQLLKQLQKIVNDVLTCKLIALWQLQEHFFGRWPDISMEKYSTANCTSSSVCTCLIVYVNDKIYQVFKIMHSVWFRALTNLM